jgi:hypothetical protein
MVSARVAGINNTLNFVSCHRYVEYLDFVLVGFDRRPGKVDGLLGCSAILFVILALTG